MASIVQLKRSALSGKVPGTGSLNLGELAVNTYDGKIYFKKSGSIESVESVLTTNSVVTGSIRLEGTGSFGSLRVNDTLTINHGEAIISGSALVTNDLTILGQVNARQFNIAVISSSVLFESGSSKFGNTSDDIHSFTGSVNITGSFLLNGQEVGGGTTTGSFTGSFTGDGSGLRGVVSDELPRNGYDYNINDIASINDFNVTSSKYLIDFDIDALIGTPVGHKTYIANFTGSTKVIPAGDSVRFHVRDVEVARIDENGFSGSINFPAGVVSGSSQLTSSYDTRYTLSGSVQPLPSNLVSSSAQITAFGFISSSTTIDTGSFNSIGFNTSAGVSVGVGELAWNNTDGTLDLGMKGGNVVQQIGQEIFYEVRNETGIQIPNGTAVYANGVTAGSGRITAAPYVADGNIRENRFLGIATENISTGVNGFVTHFGYVRDLDTRGTTASSIAVGDETWAVGDILYVHPTVSGKLTKVKPQHEITVAIIIARHQSAGVIFVRPTSSGHLGDIHDISINTGSLSNGQVLSYNSTSGVWENTNTISGSSQLTSSFDTRYALSGSVSNSSISSSMMEATKYIADGTTTVFTIPGGYYTKMLQVFLNGSKLDTSEYTETDSSNITITPPISSGSVLEIINFKAAALNSGLSRKIETSIATEGQLVFNTIASASLGNVDVHINGFKLPPQDFVVTNSNTITLTTGSFAGELVEIGLYDAFFGTYLTNTDLSSLNTFTASVSTASLASSITNLNSLTSSYATTGSNIFRGTQIHSGSIIPARDNVYDLGSLEYQWRDVFVSSGSLYIDGTKVLGSTGDELQITTDNGQSIKILEAGSDNITLQTADGDVELKSSGGGDILLDPTAGLISIKGTLQVQDGNKITSSGGNSVVFGNNITITGSIETTGNVNGINLTTFSSSIASTLLNQNTSASSYETIGRGIVSGSSQITLGSINGFSTYSSSVDNRIATEKGRVDAILSASDADKDTFAEIVTLINSVDTTNDQAFASFYTGSNNRLNNLESVTSSYETKGRGIISGSSQITFSGISSLPTLVSGSSQITLSSTTGYGSVLNQAVLTTSSPTFASITSNGNINIPGTNKIVFNNEPLSWFLQARTTASTANLGSGLKNLIYNGGGANEGIAFSGVDTGAASMEVRNDGRVWIKENLIVGGTLTENSSIRYKENVETIKYGLDKVLQMRGVTYDKKNTGVKEVGVIAEEIYEVLPEVVLKNEEGEIDSVSYGRITAVLIEAIKEQQKQIEELKALIK